MKEIVKGFGNLFLKKIGKLPEEKRLVAERKAEICSECHLNYKGICNPLKTGEVVKGFQYGREQRVEGQVVRGCGCNLEAKLLSDSQCPLGKFEDL